MPIGTVQDEDHPNQITNPGEKWEVDLANPQGGWWRGPAANDKQPVTRRLIEAPLASISRSESPLPSEVKTQAEAAGWPLSDPITVTHPTSALGGTGVEHYFERALDADGVTEICWKVGTSLDSHFQTFLPNQDDYYPEAETVVAPNVATDYINFVDVTDQASTDYGRHRTNAGGAWVDVPPPASGSDFVTNPQLATEKAALQTEFAVDQVFTKTSIKSQSAVSIAAAVRLKWSSSETPPPAVGDIREGSDGLNYKLISDPSIDPVDGHGTINDEWRCINPSTNYVSHSADRTFTQVELAPSISLVETYLNDGSFTHTYPAGMKLGYVIGVKVPSFSAGNVLTIEIPGATFMTSDLKQAFDGKAYLDIAGEAHWRKVSESPEIYRQIKDDIYSGVPGYTTAFSAPLSVLGTGTYSIRIRTIGSVPFEIEWESGVLLPAGSAATLTHTYAAPPAAGLPQVHFPEWVRPYEIRTTAGPWEITDDELVNLSRYGAFRQVRMEGPTVVDLNYDLLPDTVNYLTALGNAVGSSNLSKLPTDMVLLRLQGSVQVDGNIEDAPPLIDSWDIQSPNNDTRCFSVPTFPSSMRQFINDSTKMESTDIDFILEGLNNVATWVGTQPITLLTQSGAVPTAAGLAFKTSLEGKGRTVNVNV